MNILQTIFKYATVIFLGISIFWIDGFENINKNITIFTIAIIALSKAVYFMVFSFKKIVEVSLKNTPYHTFLLFMATNVALIIISFSIDFFCLSEIDVNSFMGINKNIPLWERYLDFLYYSVLAFTNFGYDQISPRTIVAKFLMSMELVISFATIIFILSDFISLKDSISSSSFGKKKNS
jgi:hypothetical protein